MDGNEREETAEGTGKRRMGEKVKEGRRRGGGRRRRGRRRRGGRRGGG